MNIMIKYLIIILVLLTTLMLLPNYSARYEIPADSNVVNLSAKILTYQVGVHEATNRNDGEQVEEYLHSVGLSKGSAWCMSLQYFCFWIASEATGLKNPLLRTGLANAEYNYAMKVGVLTKTIPEVNDLMIWKYTNSSFGHIERIQERHGLNTLITIGGNVSNEVRINIRHPNSPLGNMRLRGYVGFATEK